MKRNLFFRPIVFAPATSQNLGGFVEEVAPRAVERSLAEPDHIIALVGHDVLKPIGRVSAGTLELRADRRGVLAVCDLPATTYATDAAEAIRVGAASGSSFSFTVLADHWSMGPDEVPLRRLEDVDIREVSCMVSFPAYLQTEAASREAPSARVEDRGGFADRAWATRFARTFAELRGKYRGLEVRIRYQPDTEPEFTILLPGDPGHRASPPSLAMRRRQLALLGLA